MMQDRRSFIAILVADILVMAGAAFILVDRYGQAKRNLPDISAVMPVRAEKQGPPAPVFPTLSETPPSASPVPPAAPFPSEAAPPSPPPALVGTPVPVQESAGQSRNVLFEYRNSKPSRVEIVGSFNNWTPQPLTKGANHVWKLLVKLSPGDYVYNYIVDGKVIRDPNQPRTAPEGRSLLTVRSLAE